MTKVTAKHNDSQVHIWEDPGSKIQFLETSLGRKGWRAIIHSTQLEGREQSLLQMKKELDEKGYNTRMITDEQGQPALFVNKIGAEASFAEVVEEMGFAKGLRFSFSNLGVKFSHIRKKAADFLSFATENKAKSIGLIYLMGDLVMAGTFFDDAPSMTQKALKGGYGIMGALQSLIFMNYATEADQQLSKELNRKFDKLSEDGLNLDFSQDWLQSPDTRSNFTNFMEKNAITIGSLTQITGRLLWATAGKMEADYGRNATDLSDEDRKTYIQSGKDRIKDSLFSITGWLLIMMKTDKKDKEAKITNPVQFIRKYSNQIAGTANATSTFFGIRGDIRKIRQLNENHINLAGNLAYLTGDVVVALTDTSDYDERSATHPKTLGKVAAKFIESLPVIMSPAQKAQLIGQVSEYLARRAQEINSKDGQAINEAKLQEDTRLIFNAVTTELPEQNFKLDELAAKASRVVIQVPPHKQQAVNEAIAKELSKNGNILASPQEIMQAIRQQSDRQKAPDQQHSETPMDIQTPLADLLDTLPKQQNEAKTALRYYNAVESALSARSSSPTGIPRKIRDFAPAPQASYEERIQNSQPVETGIY